MAERKAVNRYYPPGWDPSKGSINKYVGSHPLRERARKLSQGILVIRFEMPYNIWCGGCNSHIGMGVRYNAEKKKTGNYYTTPIYTFRMKCHLCDNYFEIQTDPQNHDYVILNGARRKEQRWDPKENEQIVPEDKTTHKKLFTDAMYQLERGSDDKEKKKAAIPTLGELEEKNEAFKDDYILNSIARNRFRDEKKSQKAIAEADLDVLQRASLNISLVKEQEEDIKLAGLLKYGTQECYEQKQKERRQQIAIRPFFSPATESRPSTQSPRQQAVKRHITDAILNKKKNNPFDVLLSPNGNTSNGICKLSTSNQTSPTVSIKEKHVSQTSATEDADQNKTKKMKVASSTTDHLLSEAAEENTPRIKTVSPPGVSGGLASLMTSYSDSSDSEDTVPSAES